MVGVGKDGRACGRAMDDLRVEPGVRLLGHVDDATLRTLYRSAAALAFPSLHEGFGLPLLEAFAEGLPAVAGGRGAPPGLGGGAAPPGGPPPPPAHPGAPGAGGAGPGASARG